MVTLDTFEDNNITEYSGDTGSFVVEDNSNQSPHGGTYHLKTDSGSAAIISRTDTSVPNTNVTFTFYTRCDGNPSDSGFCFGNSSATGAASFSGYEVLVYSGDLQINRWDSGTATNLASTTGWTKPTSDWMSCTVDWDASGNISVTLKNSSSTTLATASATDTNYTGGGIGFSSTTNSNSSWVDDVTYVENADVATMAVGSAALSVPAIGATSTGGPSDIDLFEDGDVSEYVGETSEFSASTAQVHSGTYSGLLQSGGPINSVFSESGLNDYPNPGDVFEFWFYPTASNSAGGMYFGMTGGNATDGTPGSGYQAHYDVDLNEILVDRYDSGSNIGGTGTSVTMTAGSWYRGEVDWHNSASGDITFTVYDSGGTNLGSYTLTDSTYSNQGIGFQVDDADVHYDDVKITATPSFPQGISVDVGTFASSGPSPSASATITASGDVGTIASSGPSPSASPGTVSAAGSVATASFSGPSPTATPGTSTPTATEGVVSISLPTATPVPQDLTASVAAPINTPLTTPSVTASGGATTASASVGTITTQSFTVGATPGFTITPNLASVSLTQPTIDVRPSLFVVEPSVGTINGIGVDPAINAVATATANEGVLSPSIAAPVLDYDVTMAADVGTFHASVPPIGNDVLTEASMGVPSLDLAAITPTPMPGGVSPTMGLPVISTQGLTATPVPGKTVKDVDTVAIIMGLVDNPVAVTGATSATVDTGTARFVPESIPTVTPGESVNVMDTAILHDQAPLPSVDLAPRVVDPFIASPSVAAGTPIVQPGEVTPLAQEGNVAVTAPQPLTDTTVTVITDEGVSAFVVGDSGATTTIYGDADLASVALSVVDPSADSSFIYDLVELDGEFAIVVDLRGRYDDR